MTTLARHLLFVALPIALAAPGCTDTAKIKSDGDPVLVDQKRAGIALYDEVVKETMEELLRQHHQKVVNRSEGKLVVAFVGIENKGFEELRDHEEAIYDNVQGILVNAGYYRVISKRFVDVARRAAGLRAPEELFLKEPRERFIQALHKEGLTPDYFLWGKMTTQTSQHKGAFKKTTERRYRYSMEMVDSRSGEIVSQTQGEKIKQYKSW